MSVIHEKVETAGQRDSGRRNEGREQRTRLMTTNFKMFYVRIQF